MVVSGQEFIDDVSIFQDHNPSNYYGLKNVTRPLDYAINYRSYVDIFDDWSVPENYIPECFDETEKNYDEFDSFEKQIDCFKKDLKIFKEQSKHSFYNAILYATTSKLNEKKIIQDEKEIETILGKDVFEELKTKKDELILDLLLPSFERQCHQVNDLFLKRIFLESVRTLKKI